MKHMVTDTDIIVPVQEVMGMYIAKVDAENPQVYLCDVFKREFAGFDIALDKLGAGYNGITAQMCYMLENFIPDAELGYYEWDWGIEGAFSYAALTEFYREGNRIVYGPEYANGRYDRIWVTQRDQILVRIGMMSRIIEQCGDAAIFCIPLKGD